MRRVWARGRVVGVVGVLVVATLAPAEVAAEPDGGSGDASVATLGPVVRPKNGAFRVVGRGWGHGRGMSQYGAYAAASAGRTYREILNFYYPGTVLAGGTLDEIRVLLSHASGGFRVHPEPGLTLYWTSERGISRRVRLPDRLAGCPVSTWRVRPVDGRDMTVEGYSCGRWRSYVPARWLAATGRAGFVAPDGTVAVERRLSGGGTTRRGYRGRVRVMLRGGRLRPVNIVRYEHYLRSVVPAESPASWPQAALRAQAIAARTYAVRSAASRGSSYFDVYDTTASQAYPGMVRYGSSWQVTRRYEHPRTTAAVVDTRGMTLRYSGQAAFTEFGSSNGGWTADGGRPYLRARYDGWDRSATRNPYLTWSDTVSVRRLESWYPSIGRLRSAQVLTRVGGGEWRGRVRALRLVGTEGERVVRGEDAVRTALGLRSAWFAFVK